jgi:hypothetical protein
MFLNYISIWKWSWIRASSNLVSFIKLSTHIIATITLGPGKIRDSFSRQSTDCFYSSEMETPGHPGPGVFVGGHLCLQDSGNAHQAIGRQISEFAQFLQQRPSSPPKLIISSSPALIIIHL